MAQRRIVVIGAGPIALTAAETFIEAGLEALIISTSRKTELAGSVRNTPLKIKTPQNAFQVGGVARLWDYQVTRFSKKFLIKIGLSEESTIKSYYQESFSIESRLGIKPIRAEMQLRPKFSGEIAIGYSFLSDRKCWNEYFKQTLDSNKLKIVEQRVATFEISNNKIDALIFENGEKFPLNENDLVCLAAGTIKSTELILRSNILETEVGAGYLGDHPNVWLMKLSSKDARKISSILKDELGDTNMIKPKLVVFDNQEEIAIAELRQTWKRNPNSQNILSQLSTVPVLRIANFILKVSQQSFRFQPDNWIWVQWAQVNNPQSRISITGKKIDIKWRLSNEDHERVQKIENQLRDFLRDLEISPLKIKKFKSFSRLQRDSMQAFHPSGSLSEYKHELERINNLVVCGAATLSEPGWYNPTVPLMAITKIQIKNSLAGEIR